MADLSFFQDEFDRHATNGALGDPNGALGYAYLRVSTSAQAEEGRSGLPRQITRVHEVAAREKICIPWDCVFADDHTGFQFHDRPELSRLRAEYARPDRRADVVIIEYLDRLSRNADWHQGFFLDEMKQHQIVTLFWKSFTSRVERAVMGAVSQDGMERTLEIMQEGIREKARSGRVTSTVAAYGYRFVDGEGNPTPKAGKETYYAPHPEQADIIRLIYHKIGVEGVPLRSLCRYLEERFPPRRNAKHWQKDVLVKMVRNPLYKGEFYANRRHQVVVPAKRQRTGEPVRMVKRTVDRPREEWILVPVPPLTSEELWNAANAMLDKNAQMAKRNGRSSYLLTGLIECAECHHSYVGKRKTRHRSKQVTIERKYVCYSRSGRPSHEEQAINCTQSMISADRLEEAVWQALCEFVTAPERLLAKVEASLNDKDNLGLRKQIAFLEQQMAQSEQEDEKLYRAFMANVFDEIEYAERRRGLKAKAATLQQEREALSRRVLSHEQVEADKALILELATVAKEMGIAADTTSFAFKQRVLKLLVDKITLNVQKREFRIEGRISGIWSIENPTETTSVLPPPALPNRVGGVSIANISPWLPLWCPWLPSYRAYCFWARRSRRGS